ncbi:MAG TPA: LptA/OstA family protein, partial [Thermoanaerobaculia bacterium]|nr:LptA/OstA family protein [Thermoanaerobaculia bacterium]
MPRPRVAKNPFRRYRLLLLAAFVLVAGAVAGLYLFGRAGRPEPAAVDRSDGLAPEGEITLVGEGFEFTHSEGARRVFKIRGESVRADREGTVFLDGVGLTLYDESGAPYEVASRAASFNRETREARLQGDVVLSGPGPTRIESAGVELRQRGEVLVSTAPIAFRYQDLQGRADRLRIVRPEQVYVLAGDVRVESRPGIEPAASLVARQLVFERPRHQVRAEGEVEIVRGGDRLRAHRVAAYLDERDETMIYVRARGEVSGRSATAGGGGRPVSFAAQSLSLLRDQAGLPQSGELEGARRDPVRIDAPTPEGTVQRLTAGFATVAFRDGELATAEAFNGPRLVEIARAGRPVLRDLSGRRMEATFGAGGRLQAVRADERVRYRDERLRAEAAHARFEIASGKGRLTGDPVHLTTDRGELFTPSADYDQGSGLVEAHEGVRALIERASELGLGGTPFAEGEGPVRVESREGFFREEPRGVLFRGEVRAWQGQNLLLADELRAEQPGGGERLTATGSVRSVWVPAARPGDDAAAGPLEVTARTLRYLEADEELIYEGDVRAEQQQRILECRRLVVELTADGEAERLIATGEAHLDDRQTGNEARGESAVYDLAQRVITLTGDPARLEKADGATVAGGRVVYSLDTGTARVATPGA